MEFYFLVNIVLISRLFFGFNVEPLNLKQVIAVIIFQAVSLLLFKFCISVFILLTVLAVLNILMFVSEKKWKNSIPIRLLFLAIFVIIISIFTSTEISTSFNYPLIDNLLNAGKYFFIFSGLKEINGLTFNIHLMGILLLLNEANLAIRYFFEVFKLVPKQDQGDEVDVKEYNAGRIIGMLERIIIYIFVLAGQYAAIGFIIAAKSFTRFEQLKQRSFAEYVLIGTFLSSVFAILISLLIINIT